MVANVSEETIKKLEELIDFEIEDESDLEQAISLLVVMVGEWL